ncbi:MAG: hypothetical protein KKD59_03210, partial [Acidobacteria bacterium]|nr:hypothetical protein [Acidobacteriota bacterium]
IRIERKKRQKVEETNKNLTESQEESKVEETEKKKKVKSKKKKTPKKKKKSKNKNKLKEEAAIGLDGNVITAAIVPYTLLRQYYESLNLNGIPVYIRDKI